MSSSSTLPVATISPCCRALSMIGWSVSPPRRRKMPPRAGIIRSSTRALKEGREVVLPKAVADRLANGDNAVRVIREWRGMIQGELAAAVGISQNYLSEIENGRRKGPAELQKKFARALGVPLDLLIE